MAILLVLGGGTAGAGSEPQAYVLTQTCTSDAECDDGQFCNGWETCDSNGQCAAGTRGTCCSDPSYPVVCAEAFPRCNADSENYGVGCQSDADCQHGQYGQYGRCERCQSSCITNADCDDELLCNGYETCRRTCVGGPNDGSPCTSNADCTPGTCIGQCQPGTNPCGNSDCADHKCFNVVPTQYCQVDSDCPSGSGCVALWGSGYVCFPRVCGDGMISGSEECDPNADLLNPLPGQLPDGCFTGSTCLPDSNPQKCTCTAFCGNGHVETGEECDGDSWGVCPGWCGADCTCPPPAPSSCGNGILDWELGEECESDCDCYGLHCRLPGDPMGECTCVCEAFPGSGIDWDPSPTSLDRTSRSLRFRVEWAVGCPFAIKVTMVDLQNPNPANLPQYPPPDFSGYESATCDAAGEANRCARWVGEPETFLESQDNPLGATYLASRLQCTPIYWDWMAETAGGPITVVGAEIVPSSEYSVQAYDDSCMGVEATCYFVFAPEMMYTRRSGDVEQPFNPPSTSTQPDVTDIAQLVNKFKNIVGAPSKTIAQLQPNLPELNADINALDIVAVVDGVREKAYAFSGPCPCPSTVTCGSMACSTATPCVTAIGAGATCIKTCIDGANDGEPCINNTHCPGGTCGNGYCHDRCGRCTP